MPGRPRLALLALALLCAGPGVAAAGSPKNDRLLWTTLQLTHPIAEDWSISLWSQGRFNDDVSRGDQVLAEPSLHYRVIPGLEVGLGFRYWAKNDASDEVDLAQVIGLSHRLGTLGVGNRIRIEERFINNRSDVVVRGRYRLHLSHALGDTRFSGVLWNEVFVNLTDRSSGPSDGYEQNRLFGGVGTRVGDRLRVTAGYLWRNKRNRRANDQHDHILSLSFSFNTASAKPATPHPGELRH